MRHTAFRYGGFGLFWAALVLAPIPAHALRGADVAVYSGDGAWSNGLTAISNMLDYVHLSHESLSAADLNASTQDFSSLYRILLFPGGWAAPYNSDITKYGKQRIRRFLRQGGGYFGICAGSFFACDITRWEGTNYDDAAGYNLDLFPGTGIGPVTEIADWNAEGYNMSSFRFTNGNEILARYKTVPFSEDILYYGGPVFTPTGGNVQTLATYEYSGAYSGQAAAVAFRYGDGRVILMAPHPEIEEDSTRDGVTIDREDTMNDNGSDWDLVGHLLRWLLEGAPGEFARPAVKTDGSLQLDWSGSAERPFAIHSSTNLVDWRHVATEFTNSAAHRATVTPPAGANGVFYRLTQSLGEMSLVPGGSFQMGDALAEGAGDELPTHAVTVGAFYIDRYEMNNGRLRDLLQWAYDRGHVVVGGGAVSNAVGTRQRLLDIGSGTNEIQFANGAFRVLRGRDAFPCMGVTWYGAQAFCQYRSLMEGLQTCIDLTNWTCTITNTGYRLPTEAEWERAARGGIAGARYHWGSLLADHNANFSGSNDPFEGDGTNTTPVGYYDDLQTPAGNDMTNGYALYDMAGNLWEWCGDWYGNTYYSVSPGTDPTGPASGTYRVVRGGSWLNVATPPNYFRCSARLGTLTPNFAGGAVGFRCVRRKP